MMHIDIERTLFYFWIYFDHIMITTKVINYCTIPCDARGSYIHIDFISYIKAKKYWPLIKIS